MKNILSLLLVLASATTTFAQNADHIEMADTFRSSGKIYVVVLVMLVIFIGIITYLFSIDRKIKKLENKD